MSDIDFILTTGSSSRHELCPPGAKLHRLPFAPRPRHPSPPCLTIRVSRHKHGVLMPKVVDVPSGFELMLETLFCVGEPSKELETPNP